MNFDERGIRIPRYDQLLVMSKRGPGRPKKLDTADGQIGDSDFVGGIQHMIKEKIIDIPDLPPSSSEIAEEKVPDWIKTNAKWWADGLISEDDFVQAIEYLVKAGIIRV